MALSLVKRLLREIGLDGHDVDGDDPWDSANPRRAWLRSRPSIPPIMLLACGFWFGTAGTIESLYGVGCNWWLCPIGVSALVIVFCAFLFERGNSLVACVVLGVALGCVTGTVFSVSMCEDARQIMESPGRYEVEIVRDSRAGEFGAHALARTGQGALVRLDLPAEASLLVGERISFQAQWKKPSEKMRHQCWQDGIVAVARVQSYEVRPPSGVSSGIVFLRRRAVEMVSHAESQTHDAFGIEVPEASMLLQAIDMGHIDGLYTSALYQAVKVDGLAHMVAVSGAHLAIVCGMVAAAFRRSGITRMFSILLQILFIGSYLVFTGAPVSAMRASVMASLGLLAYVPGRRPYSLGALSFCIIAIIAHSPSASFSLSFVFSATATLGIVMFMPLFERLIQDVLPLSGGALCDSLALTMAATLITSPISACCFSQFSVVAPVANALSAPVFPVLCIGGTIAIVVGIASDGYAMVALHVLLVAAQVFADALDALSHMPFASVPVALGVAPATIIALFVPMALWLSWPKPGRGALAFVVGFPIAMAICFAIVPFLRGDVITMLDIGQGDAILVQSDGASMLIDTGTQDIELLEELASCGVRSLDAVLITHPDDDHCGSLPALRGVVDVGQVLVASDLLNQENEHCAKLRENAAALVGGSGIVGLRVGDRLQVGKMAFDVVGPDAFSDGGGNADSLVLLLAYDADGDGGAEASGLFCGDAESRQIDAYIDKGRIGDVDLYKVGHHGSAAAVDKTMLDSLEPEASMVSVGAGNRYGHPAPNTIDALRRAGSAVFRTDEQGTITCFLKPDGIHVCTER